MKFDWKPADINAIVGNPIYAINIDPVLAEPHPPLISEEQGMAANAKHREPRPRDVRAIVKCCGLIA